MNEVPLCSLKPKPQIPKQACDATRALARGTVRIRSRAPLGPYSIIMPRALWWS